MFVDLYGDKTKSFTKDVNEYTRLKGDRVYPAFYNLDKDFYFKPREPLSIHFSYLEFLDYVFFNYSDFINKDLVFLYNVGDVKMDDIRLEVFRSLYRSYKSCPKDFKKPVEVVYKLKVESESEDSIPYSTEDNLSGLPNVYNDSFSVYDGPSEVEIVLQSGKIVVDESGDPIDLNNVSPDYTTRFLNKFGDYYSKMLKKHPIECYEKYACFCWSMSHGFDISNFYDFKFGGDQVSGWSACMKLLNQDFLFTDLLSYSCLDSYVATRLVTLYEAYGFNPTHYLKYGDCSSYKVLEEVLFNGYDTSKIEPSIIPSRFLYMLPICLELGQDFLFLYKKFKVYTIHAACCLHLGLPLASIENKTFSSLEWESLVIGSYSIVYGNNLPYHEILMELTETSKFGYTRSISCPTNDLFLDKLKTIF